MQSYPKKQDQNCAGCRSDRLISFFQVQRSPVNCGSISHNRDEARAAKMGEIQLVFCPDCGLVHNQTFDIRKIDFVPGYEVALTHSKTFLDFQSAVVDRLTAKYGLNDKNILEIGCGDGSFLRAICAAGNNRGVGIDPTIPETGSFALEAGSVRFIRDFFTEKYANEIGDFICSLSMFEAISAPQDFLLMLRRMIGDRKPDIYFEVFNGFRSFESNEVWSIHYEQCNYFSLATLEDLFRRTGFIVTNSDICYAHDQYLFIEALPDSNFDRFNPAQFAKPPDSVSKTPSVIDEFAIRYEQRKEYWKQKLSEQTGKGRTVVLWGSGGKGISFLNAIHAQDEVQFVVDINPNRQGAFIPGTAQEIIAPERLVQIEPDLIILTNPIYEQEIRQQVAELNIDCEFDVA